MRLLVHSLPAPGRRFRRLLGAALGAGLLLGAPRAQAQSVVYGLGTLTANFSGFVAGQQGLVTIDPTTGAAPIITAAITGVTLGQTLVGIDYRPNTGQLFALGYDASLAQPALNAQVYVLNTTSNAATAVGSAIRLELGGAADRIGFDFNPTVDRIRVVSTNDANYRLNPVTGGVAFTDGNLAYASGTPTNPGIGSVAYSNSYIGSTSTTLYDFDELNTTAATTPGNTAILSIQSPPNNGTLTAPLNVMFGATVTGSPQAVDIDIYYNPVTGANQGYLTEVTAGGSSNFYAFDVTTGMATLRGNTVPAVLPFQIRDIAAPIAPPTQPALTGQLLYAVAGGNLISFDSGAPGNIRSAVNFGGGIAAGQTVVGIDFRPATGQLFALGYNPATTAATIYTVNLTTGGLTAVGTTPNLALGGANAAGTPAERIGFDFNPAVDRIRVVATNGANYRLNPNDGTLTATDTNLSATGVSAAAYTNNQSAANTTQLYDYDATTGTLYLQTPPNNGTLVSQGTSGLTAAAPDGADFDIFNTSGTTTNQAFLTVNTNPAAGRTTFDNLYSLALANGAATNLGAIGFGTNVTGLTAFIATGSLLTWNGTTSTDWGTATNWTPAQVPVAYNDVTIPSGAPNQPTVSNAQQARLLTIASGATLTLAPGGTLTTGGNVTNNGTVTGTGTGTLVLGGTAVVLGGTGLSTLPNLTTGPNAASTAGPVAVQSALTLNAALTIGPGQSFTLLSTAANTAYVVQNTGGALLGTATVQRAIDGSLNSGLGYRHYSSPVQSTTVADLTTGGFAPVVNSSYNTSATPGTVTPFPTVYGYDQSRLASTTNNLSAFDKGFVSPATTGAALVPGQGYAVNIGANQLVDFVGTVTTGDVSQTLARNAGATAADAGWQLVGNPYPAPLDYSLVAPADRANLDAAIYVVQSSGQYAGTYRANVNGVGGNSNSPNPVLAQGQGFFVRVSAGQTSGTLTFRNSQRTTTGTPFQRPTADVRPLVQLELRGTAGPADALYAYAEAGTTLAYDNQLDAEKLPNPSGLNLSSTATSGEALAIDGRPAFDATTVLPLAVGVPAAGAYTLTAAQLNNLPAGLDPYLTDAQTGQTVNLRTQPAYAFTVTAAQAQALLVGRFTLGFAARALATTPALTAAQVQLYPNPAHARFAVLMPGVVGATAVQAELLNALGQVVRRQSAALPASGTLLQVETSELAAGVYTLRLRAGNVAVAKRVVLQ